MTEKKDRCIEIEREAHAETPELLYLFPVSVEIMMEKMRQAKLRAHYMMLTLQEDLHKLRT
jgi:hypothetical protein